MASSGGILLVVVIIASFIFSSSSFWNFAKVFGGGEGEGELVPIARVGP
jgi:hypothetical protein